MTASATYPAARRESRAVGRGQFARVGLGTVVATMPANVLV